MNTKTAMLAAATIGLAACSSYGQGTVVFSDSGSAPSVVTTNNGVTTGKAGTTSSSGIRIELFYQPDTGGSAPTGITGLTGIGNWETIGSATTIAPVAGDFSGGTLSTGTDVYAQSADQTGNIWLIAVAWNGGATTYATAGAVATYFGASSVWSQGTGNPNGTPQTAAVSTSGFFPGLQLTPIPEPSTIALAGLGAASLLLFRRRK